MKKKAMADLPDAGAPVMMKKVRPRVGEADHRLPLCPEPVEGALQVLQQQIYGGVVQGSTQWSRQKINKMG